MPLFQSNAERDAPDLGEEFSDRFGELLKVASKNPPLPNGAALVPVAGKQSLLMCQGFLGGQDVELVLVHSLGGDAKPQPVRETLTYRRDIAGSDLVYDLTGEFMQGKARPFDCDLRLRTARLYALLPFQVDALSVVAKHEAGKIAIEIEFRDALGKRVRGTLPCHAELRQPDKKVLWERSLATYADGTLTAVAELPAKYPTGKWVLVTRSLLDGSQVTSAIDV